MDKKEQQYLEKYFMFDAERKWKIQNYIAGLSYRQCFELYIARKINWKDMTVRRYLSEQHQDQPTYPQQDH